MLALIIQGKTYYPQKERTKIYKTIEIISSILSIKPHTSMLLKNILEEAHKLSYEAHYDLALNKLKPVWENIDKKPQIDGLPIKLKAELLLQCGIIAGYLGNRRKFGQYWAKKYLYQARNLFIKLSNIEKIVICENNLAMCCMRGGQYNTAEKWLKSSLKRNIPHNFDAYIQTLIFKTSLLIYRKKYVEMVSYSLLHKSKIEKYGSDKNKGIFFQNMSYGLKNIGEFEEALSCLEKANEYYEPYNISLRAEVQNGLAMFHYTLGEYSKAHHHSNIAIEMFNQSGDTIREGFTYETKTQIYTSEKKFYEAEVNARIAVSILEGTNEYGLFIEALISKFKAEFLSGNTISSLQTYNYAVEISKKHLGREIHSKVIKTFAELIGNKNKKKENISITVPDYDDIEYYLINETDLAVVRKIEASSGDYALIKYDNENTIGILEIDNDLTLYILHIEDESPLVLAKETGVNPQKVIGICEKENGYRYTAF